MVFGTVDVGGACVCGRHVSTEKKMAMLLRGPAFRWVSVGFTAVHEHLECSSLSNVGLLVNLLALGHVCARASCPTASSVWHVLGSCDKLGEGQLHIFHSEVLAHMAPQPLHVLARLWPTCVLTPSVSHTPASGIEHLRSRVRRRTSSRPCACD